MWISSVLDFEVNSLNFSFFYLKFFIPSIVDSLILKLTKLCCCNLAKYVFAFYFSLILVTIYCIFITFSSSMYLSSFIWSISFISISSYYLFAFYLATFINFVNYTERKSYSSILSKHLLRPFLKSSTTCFFYVKNFKWSECTFLHVGHTRIFESHFSCEQ